MNIGQRLPRRGIMLTPVALLLFAVPRVHAQGSISGRVTAQSGGAPLAEARVAVVGTNLISSTDPDGR